MKRWTSILFVILTSVATQGAANVDLVEAAPNPTARHAHPCPSGSPGCVDQTLAAMRFRLAELTASCEHLAVFSLVYLRTTEGFRDAAARRGFFDDQRWVNAEDALFAAYYFNAYDAWTVGKNQGVPPAWRVAFEAARSKSTTGIGDLLLGMNAHVTRDLPFVLAESGLVTATGASRKPDHDRIDDMLAVLWEPVLAEAAARFRPRLRDVGKSSAGAREAAFTALLRWRETAWLDATALTGAADPAARTRIARDIERRANVRARTLRAAFTALPPPRRVARHCAVQAQCLNGTVLTARND